LYTCRQACGNHSILVAFMILSGVTLADVRAAMQLPLPGLRGQARMAPADRLDPELYARGSRDCRRAAVLLLVYPWQGDVYTVLTVRPRHLPDHPGQVSLPGGAKDEGETVEQTALREAEEEVGIDPGSVELLGRLTHLYIPPSRFCLQAVVGFTPVRPRWRIHPQEVSELLEVPLAHFLDHANWGQETWVVDGITRQVPFFRIGEHQIWGATAIVLAEFVTALEEVVALGTG
jgi:8-oxo-dGTP pyrophosphatase MutT (NUDIX family)